MKLARLPYEPGSLADLFDESLTSLGALCERTWHDKLAVVAEGNAARPWREDGTLHETELRFLPAGDASQRTAATDVFPGAPLIFKLAETLRPQSLQLDRVVIAPEPRHRLPDVAVAERLWLAQRPGAGRWRLTDALKADWHFSLAALARCEIQAIDQHWSLHRLAVSLHDGQPDDALASSLEQSALTTGEKIAWPKIELSVWREHLLTVANAALAPDLAPIRARQSQRLTRELARVDEYFANYEAELNARASRSRTNDAKAKLASRLVATRAEREHRRKDQITRHETQVIIHLDALLLIAEPAWRATVSFHHDRETHEESALFIPRARRWVKR